MPNPDQQENINLGEVTARNSTAQHIVAGFVSTMPTLTGVWRYLEEAFTDVPVLAAEIGRLAAELKDARLDHANLLAAAHATIAAYHDGENDPLSYLHDDLNEQTSHSADSRGRA